MNSTEAQEIFNRIRKVDWYYNYSDDYSVWKAGSDAMSSLKAFVKNREWTSDDIATLKLEVKNTANLQNFKTDEGKEDWIKSWNGSIDWLFAVKESSE